MAPRDKESGQFIIDLVNLASLTIPNHTLKAGWNYDLPESTMISVRYESFTKKDPLIVIEDPKKGLAAMNEWTMDSRHKEITYLNTSADPSNQAAVFARVIVSRRVCELIQKQRGQLWISGGTATANWPASNGNILDGSFQVTYDQH